jgi:decaprenylphospho-beta-D-erythro-pentofuranosid-2-ulose 2-reductase
MKNILIIGAASAIAEETAKVWAPEGCNFFLAGRNLERLESISRDLLVRGANKVICSCLDLSELDLHANLLDEVYTALPYLDVTLIAHGVLPNQNECEASVGKTLDDIKINALSYISFLTLLANRFEAAGTGTIAVISSVAGDRGRKTNYVYGSSKAMISTFCSGLMHRFSGSDVNIITIKPGLVSTPMTAGFDKGPIWSDPSAVAKKIALGVAKRKTVVYAPAFWFFIMLVIKSVPNKIFQRLNF